MNRNGDCGVMVDNHFELTETSSAEKNDDDDDSGSQEHFYMEL